MDIEYKVGDRVIFFAPMLEEEQQYKGQIGEIQSTEQQGAVLYNIDFNGYSTGCLEEELKLADPKKIRWL